MLYIFNMKECDCHLFYVWSGEGETGGNEVQNLR